MLQLKSLSNVSFVRYPVCKPRFKPRLYTHTHEHEHHDITITQIPCMPFSKESKMEVSFDSIHLYAILNIKTGLLRYKHYLARSFCFDPDLKKKWLVTWSKLTWDITWHELKWLVTWTDVAENKKISCYLPLSDPRPELTKSPCH